MLNRFLVRILFNRILWDTANEKIQTFAFDYFGGRFFQLRTGQMDQQIRNGKNRIFIFLTNADIYFTAIFFYHDTVKGQWDRLPLILLDTAVIMGIQVGESIRFIQGIRLYINTG